MSVVDEKPEGFPFAGILREKLRFLLRFALLAPSTHNTQPWIFRLSDDGIDIYADRTRAVPSVDPEQRELTMSVGAALDHLRLAMVCHLLEPQVWLLPDGGNPDLLARVSCTEEAVPSHAQLEAFGQVNHRHTYRGPMEDRLVSPEVLDQIRKSVNDPTSGIVFVQDKALQRRIAEMVRLGDEALLARTDYREGVSNWVRTDYSTGDGIPAQALALRAEGGEVSRWRLARFDVAEAKSYTDSKQVDEAPVVAIICTVGDEPKDWLLAGMAISRVALSASALGLRCSYFLQPIQFPDFRSELAEGTRALGYPQIVLRMGYAAEGVGTPRRQLDEVFIERKVCRTEPVRTPDGGLTK